MNNLIIIRGLIFLFGLGALPLSFAQQAQDESVFQAAREQAVWEPLYPVSLQENGAPIVEVVIDYMIDAEGNVFEPTVVKSFNSELFEELSLIHI